MTDRSRTPADSDGLVAPEVRDALATALERNADTPVARPARRRRLIVALSVAAVAAGAVVAISAAGPSDGPVDIVSEARAALSPRSEMLHYVVKGTPVEPSDGLNPRPLGSACPQTGSSEVWQTTAPDRWRAVLPANPRGPRCPRTFDRHGQEVVGPTEVAWDRGTSSRYQPGTGTLDIIRGYAPNSSARNVPVSDQRLGTGDPVTVLRRLLASGTVRDTGGTTLEGREVRVLEGTVEERSPRGKAKMTTEMIYAVDAESFAPVRAVTTRHFSRRSGQRGARGWFTASFGQRLDFTVYEHLPLTPKTERLLAIRPATRTDTTDLTLDEFRRELRRLRFRK